MTLAWAMISAAFHKNINGTGQTKPESWSLLIRYWFISVRTPYWTSISQFFCQSEGKEQNSVIDSEWTISVVVAVNQTERWPVLLLGKNMPGDDLFFKGILKFLTRPYILFSYRIPVIHALSSTVQIDGQNGSALYGIMRFRVKRLLRFSHETQHAPTNQRHIYMEHFDFWSELFKWVVWLRNDITGVILTYVDRHLSPIFQRNQEDETWSIIVVNASMGPP